jgi:hypothetical protein
VTVLQIRGCVVTPFQQLEAVLSNLLLANVAGKADRTYCIEWPLYITQISLHGCAEIVGSTNSSSSLEPHGDPESSLHLTRRIGNCSVRGCNLWRGRRDTDHAGSSANGQLHKISDSSQFVAYRLHNVRRHRILSRNPTRVCSQGASTVPFGSRNAIFGSAL